MSITPLRSAVPRGEFSGYLKVLRAAWSDVGRRWRSPRRIERAAELRHFDAIIVLLVIGAIFGVAITSDESVARAAFLLPGPVVVFFAQVTRLGESGYVFALCVVIGLGALLLRGRGRGARFDRACRFVSERAFYLFVLAAVSGLASQALIHLFGRARPRLIDLVGPYHFDLFALKATYASFPSGHSVTIFAMAIGLAYMVPRLRYWLLAVAVMVALSRVAISAHYPSDIIAGAALGAGSAVLLRRLFAMRGIAFRWTPTSLRLRGAGRVWPALVSPSRP